jgi:hypothetical protein
VINRDVGLQAAALAIPDSLMPGFLHNCSLGLVTCPELRAAYETKYSYEFGPLPAVVPDHLIAGSSKTSTGGYRRGLTWVHLAICASRTCGGGQPNPQRGSSTRPRRGR